MLSRLDGTLYLCGCGARTPVETAYYDALAQLPFTNTHYICNYVWRRVASNVSLGQVYRVELPSPLDTMHWVSASANAPFPVHVSVVERSASGFSIVAGANADHVPQESVKVAWTAAGWVGPGRPLFIEAISRAFELFFEDPLRTSAMLRGTLLEAAIAYETFAAWYLTERIWTDEFFGDSKNKADRVSELISRAGIAALTQVPIRVALRHVDLHRVFDALSLPVARDALTRDRLLRDIQSGISLRNAVAHKGHEEPDPQIVESYIRAVYFLMEAVMLNVAWQHDPLPQDRHTDVAG